MATKSKVGAFKKFKKIRKKRKKNLTFCRPRFWRLFETFWGGFWGQKSMDFIIFSEFFALNFRHVF